MSSGKFSTMTSAILFYYLSGLEMCVPVRLFFLSWTEERPVSAWKSFFVVISLAFEIQSSGFSFLVQSVSLNIDMNVITPSN